MSDTVIKVENLSKLYQLGQVGTGTLRHDLNRWWNLMLGKEDPYAKIGQTNVRDGQSSGSNDFVWALRNINLEVKQGDTLGIIGKNGAGKSTLLKILSRVTSPTEGTIKVKGRIASLLEVGTGFHPELTGRENIFLNGAILGMTKAEIRHKLDEIIEFSGVSKYIDTPVKRYSSGMYVRLAFAVAAHLEAEILIVDEVLAVGDAEFQKKCLGKMQDASTKEGRTVLFVSHNLGAIGQLCRETIILKDGFLNYQGETKNAIDQYLKLNQEKRTIFNNLNSKNDTDILEVKVVDINSPDNAKYTFAIQEEIVFHFFLKINRRKYPNITLSINVFNSKHIILFSSDFDKFNYENDIYIIKAIVPNNTLVPDSYYVNVSLHMPNIQIIKYIENAINFEVTETGSNLYKYSGNNYGCIFLNIKWDVVKIN
jgi:lipopolysaccharide transport system ATP-binding protein